MPRLSIAEAKKLGLIASKPRKAKLPPHLVGRPVYSLAFTLPLPPSTNNLYVNVRGQGRVPSKQYTAWQKAAAMQVPKDCHLLPSTFAVELAIEAGRDWNWRGDIANREKAVIDLLVKRGVLLDDNSKYLRELRVTLTEHPDREDSRVVVRLLALTGT